MNIPRVAGNIGLAVQMVFDRLISWLQRWLTLNVDAVANLAALAALDASSISNGNAKRVLTLRADFVLDKSSALAPDGITVVAAVGGGRWIRMVPEQFDTVWQRQTTWFINATTGNDENVGDTSLAPIKTWAEYGRRTGINGGASLPAVTVAVTIMTDLPESDPVNVDCEVDPAGLVTVSGTRTVVSGPYVVGAYAFNTATNTPPSITSTWTPATFLNQMIYFDSGSAANAAAWVFKDAGGGVGYTTRPTRDDASQTPAPGDVFNVVSLPTVYSTLVAPRSGGSNVPPIKFGMYGVVLKDLTITTGAASISTFTGGGGMSRCNLTSPLSNFNGWFNGQFRACRFAQIRSFNSNMAVFQCLFTSSFQPWGSEVTLNGIFVPGSNCQPAMGSTVEIQEVGAFDCTSTILSSFGNAYIFSQSAGSGRVYGTGNTGLICSISTGDRVLVVAAWTVTSTNVAPYKVGSESYSYSELPRTDLRTASAFCISGSLTSQVFSFNVADPTALGLVPTTAVPNGTYAFVVSVREPFVLNTASAAVADGINVITAQDGGRWIRLGSNPISVGVAGNLTAGATRFALQNLTENAAEFPIIATRAGNLRNLRCRLGTAPSGAESVQVTLFVNGVQTTAPIRATLTGANVTAFDATHLQAIAIDDRISVQIVNSNLGGFAAANLQVSFEIA